ncbi:MAG: 4Fe-4S cluster-binding domain-containing protein [Oscillospiraceae bacterium]
MKIKTIVDEDFSNYKKASMLIAFSDCDWKCCKEGNFPSTTCQNSPIARMPNTEVSCKTICERYLSNPITSAIVCGGLEPMLQFSDVFSLLARLRENGCNDDFVIYTGYYVDEVLSEVEMLKMYPNVIVKFGRYLPSQEPHFDDMLGVNLASSNQCAMKIS